MKRVLTLAGALALVAGVTAADPAQAADGETVFKKCTSCHNLSEDMDHGKKLGPNLWGVVGSKPASKEGYSYSESYEKLAAKGETWTKENLMGYIENPKKFLSAKLGEKRVKSKMTFFLKDEEERSAVIDYLATKK